MCILALAQPTLKSALARLTARLQQYWASSRDLYRPGVCLGLCSKCFYILRVEGWFVWFCLATEYGLQEKRSFQCFYELLWPRKKATGGKKNFKRAQCLTYMPNTRLLAIQQNPILTVIDCSECLSNVDATYRRKEDTEWTAACWLEGCFFRLTFCRFSFSGENEKGRKRCCEVFIARARVHFL